MVCDAQLLTTSHENILETGRTSSLPESCGAHQVLGGCLGPCGPAGGKVGVGGEETQSSVCVCFPFYFGAYLWIAALGEVRHALLGAGLPSPCLALPESGAWMGQIRAALGIRATLVGISLDEPVIWVFPLLPDWSFFFLIDVKFT